MRLAIAASLVVMATAMPPQAIGQKAFSPGQFLLIKSAIEKNAEVRESSIRQAGRQVNLLLVVDQGTSASRARQLGDSFVRIAKRIGPDDNPGRTIGQGQFDYLVGVYDLGNRQIVMGAKNRNAVSISW